MIMQPVMQPGLILVMAPQALFVSYLSSCSTRRKSCVCKLPIYCILLGFPKILSRIHEARNNFIVNIFCPSHGVDIYTVSTKASMAKIHDALAWIRAGASTYTMVTACSMISYLQGKEHSSFAY